MALPTVGDVHVDRPMTTMSLAFLQDDTDFVSMQVFPSIPSPNKSDLYYKYNRGDFFRNNMQLRAPGAPAAAGGYKLATGQFLTEVYAEKFIISDQVRANSDNPLQPDRDATAYLTQQALINREVNWSTAYFGPGIWGTDLTGVTGVPSAGQFLRWSQTGSTPIDDVINGLIAIKQNTGKWANRLVLGASVFAKLLTHPQITDRLKYGQTAPGPVVVNLTDLQALFKVEKVLVMSSIQTTNSENLVLDSDDATTPDTFSFIGGNNVLLTYAAPAPGILVPSAGYTFNWTGLTGATAAGMRIKKYRWEIDAADHCDIESAYAFAQVSRALGYFFNGAL